MYNKELKNEYIIFRSENSAESNRKLMTSVFNKIGKVESEFNMDISAVDSYELAELVINLVLSGSIGYQRLLHYIIKDYIDWCILNSKTANKDNIFSKIDISKLNNTAKYKSTMLKDENQLISYLNISFKNIRDNSIDNLYRTIIMLSYSGIKIDDIINLRKTDVDLKNENVKIGDQYVSIGENTVAMLEYYMEQKEYVYAMRIKAKFEDEYLMQWGHPRNKNDKVYCAQAISNANQVYRRETNTNIFLSIKKILDSGIFYRIYEHELKTNIIDMSEYCYIYNLTEGSSSLKTKEMQAKIKEGKGSYVNWRKTFY